MAVEPAAEEKRFAANKQAADVNAAHATATQPNPVGIHSVTLGSSRSGPHAPKRMNAAELCLREIGGGGVILMENMLGFPTLSVFKTALFEMTRFRCEWKCNCRW